MTRVNTVRSFAQDVDYHRDINRAVAEAKELSRIIDSLVLDYGSPSRHSSVRTTRAFDKIQDILHGRGWTFSGNGHFAGVWTKGGTALKIGLKNEDSGATYAAWARANQGKPAVPNIHALMRGEFHYAVVMDRLYKFDRHSPRTDPHLMAEYECLRDAVVLGMRDYSTNFPSVETGVSIHHFFKGLAEFDLHSGNVMLDRHGNLVITDPVSFCGIKEKVANDNPRPEPRKAELRGIDWWPMDRVVSFIQRPAAMPKPNIAELAARNKRLVRNHDHLVCNENAIRIRNVA